MTDAESPTETGTTTQEYVEVEKASDEDLTSYLEGVKNGTYSGTEEEEDETPSDSPEESEVAEETPVVNGAAKSEEKPQDSEDRVTLSRSELAALQSRIEKQAEENRQKEEFIQRQKKELGDARQQAKAYKAEIERRLENVDSPVDAHRLLLEADKADQALQEIDQKERHIDHVKTTYDTVTKAVKLDEIPTEDVVELLSEEGASQQQIAAFIQNPWSADATALVQFFKRVKDRSELKRHQSALNELVGVTRQLMDKLKEQQGKPERMLSEISKTMKKGPSLNASSGTADSRRGIADMDVTKLSNDELDRLFEETKTALRR